MRADRLTEQRNKVHGRFLRIMQRRLNIQL